MGKKTPLFDQHEQQGARIVDFGGWDMPVNYGSQIEEHHQVRTDAGMFDVSHMTVVDLAGERVIDFLRKLLTKDVAKLKGPGKAVYTCMLNERGGIIDDLITYYIDDEHFRMVVNAATREKDLTWIRKQAEPFGVEVTERDDTAMVALQGPNAREKAATVLDEAVREEAMALKLFNFGMFGDLFIARTGYTGEDGWEMILPADKAPEYWRKWLDAGIRPVGLGARDTLRLEAGLNLYGTDMDEDTHPMESGLGWTVAWEPADRDFIGRAALEAAREKGVDRQLVGLVLEGRGVLRSHQPVIVDGEPAGEVTGGTFSPTLNRSIALARVPVDIGERCQVEIRKRRLDAKVVKPPFVRQGEIQVDLD